MLINHTIPKRMQLLLQGAVTEGGEKVLEDARGNREGHLVAPIR
jgi:hypothetical protein